MASRGNRLEALRHFLRLFGRLGRWDLNAVLHQLHGHLSGQTRIRERNLLVPDATGCQGIVVVARLKGTVEQICRGVGEKPSTLVAVDVSLDWFRT